MAQFGRAWKTFWQVLGGAELVPKSELQQMQEKLAAAEKQKPKLSEATRVEQVAPDRFAEGAVYTLLLLQREGRLVDFLQEDLSGADDEQIGVAVRQIHANCAKVLRETFHLGRVLSGTEGEPVKLPTQFDPSAIKLTGQVGGQAPRQGKLVHAGWRAQDPHFPTRTGQVDVTVVQPAEVEV